MAKADATPTADDRNAHLVMDGQTLVAAAVEPLRRSGVEALNACADAIERACGAVLNHIIVGPADPAVVADAATAQAKANIANPADGTVLPDHVVEAVHAAPDAEAAQAVVDEHLANAAPVPAPVYVPAEGSTGAVPADPMDPTY